MTTRTFDLAALDMAGTTVDEGGLVYDVLDRVVSDAVGHPVPHDLLARWKGTSKREAIAGLLAELGEPAETTRVDVVFADFVERLTTAYRDAPPKPVAGIGETFSALHEAGVKIALQTGYSSDIAQAILDGLGWTVGGYPSDTVDALITSDLVPASRPAPYLIYRCMEATGVTDVRRVLVAGDTPSDVLAGHNAAAGFVVGVLSGSFGAETLEQQPLTHILPSAADVTQLLHGASVATR
ncbi:phosphonatase-like hydrolase [Williamsia sp. 1135]|uniref:phosphonatase-like hydrolase n=1 Tax=Williamsia sp. 1135 TaxID=1889262 RepID=UPI000A101ED5|nr:phosphonatase-like hydrolase [Williamsia sp. 1135]ORM30612.1 HAD family hydrolase [Williamsia sp. 1135]